ncbi:MAG UNVERIFIED_CONTAM: hypothetical protein LVT10_03895 [Anaerolineae bacterium]
MNKSAVLPFINSVRAWSIPSLYAGNAPQNPEQHPCRERDLLEGSA